MIRQDFCTGWRFRPAGESEWTDVTLPHDAMIHRPRVPDAPSGSAQAFFPGGTYVYEKTFQRPEAEHVVLQFEGVYQNPKVYLNGQYAGGTAYGYLPFFVEADGFLQEGENTIVVECDNEAQPASRWYTGAGIYRPVRLWTGKAQSIEPEQIQVRTVSVRPARIRVITGAAEARIRILNGGTLAAVGAGAEAEIEIPDAKLWSAEAPNLYTCRVETASDSAEVTFGVRMIECSAKGLFVNGESVLLRGGCVHQDSGILGAATYEEAELRRIRMLKEAGFNAIRSSHNPANPALLAACDAVGMYVIDEAWDMWFFHKNTEDYAGVWREHYLDDLRAVVSRDFNHPCVIMYSIGNEVSEPAKPEGLQAADEMISLLHELDSSRPVTAGANLMIIANAAKGKGVYKEEGGRENDSSNQFGGMNSTMFNMITNMVGTGMNKAANSKKADAATSPFLDKLDACGYNYGSGRYPLEGKAHPDRVVMGSETFPQDIWKNWQMVKQYPYLIGDFMWTAWDYLGEAGIGTWAYTPDGKTFDKPYPWLLGDTGAIDILGNPNAELFLAQAAWGLLKAPAIGVRPVNHPGVKPIKSTWRGTNAIPSWSWAGCAGNAAVIEVCSDAAQIELQLNGKSLGKKKGKDGKAVFKTKYVPGTLTAIARDAKGTEVGRSALRSAVGSIRISVEPEERTAKPGQIVFVPVALRGENGEVESNADRTLTVSVDGGELLAFGSANPRTEERFDSGTYASYYGRALAVVRVGGTTVVTVTDGEERASAVIAAE